MKQTTTLGLLLLVALGAAGTSSDPASDPAFDGHRLAKRALYAGLTMQSAFGVLIGTEQPLLPFVVLDDPPSVFFNYEIAPGQVDALSEFLELPPGFELAPVAIVEGETPRLYLSLNIYAVDGLGGALSGNRAEWSVYVSKDGGRPSFMVVEARSSVGSLDPVNWFTDGTPLEHERTEIGILSDVESEDGTKFQALIGQSGIDGAQEIFTTTSWAAANDRIYWRNGVADRVYYDGLLTNTEVLSVDPGTIRAFDNTLWSQFINPQPVNVLVYQTRLELVISPWYNVDPE